MINQYDSSERVVPGKPQNLSNVGKASYLIPNDKCIALNILDSHLLLKFDPSEEDLIAAKEKLLRVFYMISTSMMSEDLKSKWLLCFSWTLLWVILLMKRTDSKPLQMSTNTQ